MTGLLICDWSGRVRGCRGLPAAERVHPQHAAVRAGAGRGDGPHGLAARRRHRMASSQLQSSHKEIYHCYLLFPERCVGEAINIYFKNIS